MKPKLQSRTLNFGKKLLKNGVGSRQTNNICFVGSINAVLLDMLLLRVIGIALLNLMIKLIRYADHDIKDHELKHRNKSINR